MKNYTKVREYVRLEEANFQNRLLYAQLTSEYDVYSASKYGYIDGAEYALKVDNAIILNKYVEAYIVDDEYDKAFTQAINDYVKYELKGEIE